MGHSGGGTIIHGAVDARPDKVERAVYVDSGPLGEGGVINDELPAEGDDIPRPPWESFDDADLPTGHWPQFTKPAELARAILAAVDRSGMD